MTRTTTPTTIIGPSDHGRRMSLEEFDHVTEVARIERGLRNPRVTTLVRLADVLEVSSAVLPQGVAPSRP